MFRLLKALPLTLAVAALSIIAIGCGSGSSAKVRVVNAIPDASANLDININGTKDFTNVQFDAVYPTQTTPASYVSVPSGSDTIEAFNTGTTSSPVVAPTTASLSGSTQYTVLLGNYLNKSPQAYLMTDNNTVPTTGNVEIRVINGSALANAESTGIDVFIYQTGLQPPGTPQISALPLGSASSYQSLTWESSYHIDVYITNIPAKQLSFDLPQGGSSGTAGQITTLVIMDNPGGASIDPFPLVMVDLN
jgi:Domain of unknown function (DUF4397)